MPFADVNVDETLLEFGATVTKFPVIAPPRPISTGFPPVGAAKPVLATLAAEVNGDAFPFGSTYPLAVNVRL